MTLVSINNETSPIEDAIKKAGGKNKFYTIETSNGYLVISEIQARKVYPDLFELKTLV